MSWDAQSDRAAIRYYSDWCPDGIQEAHRRGARWQRAALLSDEAVERAARGMYENADTFGAPQTPWEEQTRAERNEWAAIARVALMAALEGEQ